MYVLGFIGLAVLLVIFAVVTVFLEAAFSNWEQDGLDDSDDLDDFFRKRHYGD